jgi:hypothetical protein
MQVKSARFFLVFASYIFLLPGVAQRNFTLYQFQNTQQSLYLNPAFRPNIRAYTSFGLGLASFGVTHTGFRLNDLLTPRPIDDSLVLNVGNAINKMAELNRISFDFLNELFGLGIRVNKTHLMFSATLKNQLDFFYPKDLFRFVFEGNGASLLGQRANLDGLGVKMNVFMEYAGGFNRTLLDDKLCLGARVKVISGLFNAHTSRSQLGIHTSDSTFDITIDGAITLNTSNLNPFLDRNYFGAYRNGFNFKNVRLGLDLGARYQLTDEVELSASLIDLGFIRWDANNRNFISNDVNFTFKGIDIKQFLSDSTAYLNHFSDSLQGVFSTTENTNAYSTSLNTRFFVGARVKMASFLYANALMFNEFILGKYFPGLALGATIQLSEFLTFSGNYILYGRFAQNLGVGVNLRLGALQFFTITDNLIGIINFRGARNLHFSAGMSISIGKPDKQKNANSEGG